MTQKRDYYEVLGVGREAGSDDIRKAYKQAALKYHPDRNPGDKGAEDKFKEATEAFGVLSDAEKRQRYDQFGHAGLEGMGGMDFGGADIFSHFQDLFSDFFGGTGQVSNARGFVMFTTTCPACRGQGSIIAKPCESCHGAGQVEKTRKVLVTFPAGIDAGQRLRVPRQGASGPQGGPPGDLYVDIDVQADERFERDGADLFTRARVSFADAALGTTVKLSLLDETELEIEVAPGTQPGEVLSLRGKGVPRVDGGGRGSLHVVVQVEVPKRVSAKAKTLLRELEKELAQPSSDKRANVG
jgi:molecular chaperone DnaJ